MIRLGIVDIDGVVARFNEAFAQLGHKHFPDRIPLLEDESQITCWHWPVDLFGLSREEESVLWLGILEDPAWWEGLQPYEDFDPYEIDDYRLPNVVFVTARPVNALVPTVRWLEGLGFHAPVVIMARLSSPDGDKGSIAMNLGPARIDYVVDDRVSNLLDVRFALPQESTTRCYLVDRPWNQKEREPWMRIVANLDEVAKLERLEDRDTL